MVLWSYDVLSQDPANGLDDRDALGFQARQMRADDLACLSRRTHAVEFLQIDGLVHSCLICM
jgi:hypothetical protein